MIHGFVSFYAAICRKNIAGVCVYGHGIDEPILAWHFTVSVLHGGTPEEVGQCHVILSRAG